MERREELIDSLGESNLDLLLYEVRTGRIKIVPTIRMMASRMGGTVYGVYTEKMRKDESPEQVMLAMLDCWNNEGSDGHQQLIDILNDKGVAQFALAKKIGKGQPVDSVDLDRQRSFGNDKGVAQNALAKKIGKGQHVDSVDLARQRSYGNHKVQGIGLPEKHFELPLVTAKPATPSNQHCGLTCASHAIGKAIVEIIDSIGWDADQEKIIADLIAKVQPKEQAENPDKFNNVRNNVFVRNQEDPTKTEDIIIQIRVKTHFGKTEGRPHTYNTTPASIDFVEEKVRMVLRWDMWDSNENDYAPHAIYAKNFTQSDGLYSCINSWGEEEKSTTVPKSEIYAIDYISITQII